MKYCSKCGNELMDEAVVCTKCGCMVEKATSTNSKNEENRKALDNVNMLYEGTFSLIMGIASLLVTFCLIFSFTWEYSIFFYGLIGTAFPLLGLFFGMKIRNIYKNNVSSLLGIIFSSISLITEIVVTMSIFIIEWY